MATETNDRIINRIKKLLQHAAGEGHHSEEEVESALRLARKLQDEYNIADEQVKIVSDEDARKSAYESIVEGVAYEKGGLELYMRILTHVPCHINDVKCYLGHAYKGRTHQRTVVFYGLPRDVEVAKALYRELLTTVRTMARLRLGQGWGKSHFDYCLGFCSRLAERARTMKEGSVAANSTTAIVLCKDALVTKYAAEKLSLGKPRASGYRIGDSRAYSAGSEDANKVELGNEDRQVGYNAKRLS